MVAVSPAASGRRSKVNVPPAELTTAGLTPLKVQVATHEPVAPGVPGYDMLKVVGEEGLGALSVWVLAPQVIATLCSPTGACRLPTTTEPATQ